MKSKTRRTVPRAIKRSDGRWEMRVVVGYNEQGNPIRKSFYGDTEKEATDQGLKFLVKKGSGGFVAVAKDAAVQDWLDQWMSVYVKPNREPGTALYYEKFIRVHIKPAIGKVKLQKLTTQHVQQLLNEKSASLSTSSVHGILRTIRAALNAAWKEGLIEHNVASRATPPKLKQKRVDALTRDEVQTLLAGTNGQFLHSLIKFTIATGVRLGEATGLTWDCINLDAKVAQIEKQLQRVDGKLTLKSVKSASSRRPVALSQLAVDALSDRAGRKLLDDTPSPMNLVFLNHEGRALDHKYVDEHLKTACRQSGIRPVSFHILRHTAATLMVAGGVPLHTVMRQLGHSNISLTANLYGHLVKEAQQNAVDRLDEVINKGF